MSGGDCSVGGTSTTGAPAPSTSATATTVDAMLAGAADTPTAGGDVSADAVFAAALADGVAVAASVAGDE